MIRTFILILAVILVAVGMITLSAALPLMAANVVGIEAIAFGLVAALIGGAGMVYTADARA